MNAIVEKNIPFQQLVGDQDLEKEETLDLVRYWRAISRNKWRIIALATAVGILAMLFANSLKPIYRATTTILVESTKQKLVSIEDVYNQMGARDFLPTQTEILKSRDLATKLVRKLNLTAHKEFSPQTPRPASFWTDWLPAGLVGEPEQELPAQQASERSVAARVQAGLSVQPVRGSQLIRISFDSFDRELTAAIPNALAETYIESDLEARMGMTQKATSWLTGQSGDLRRKLVESEQALQSYRERERIVDVKGMPQGGTSMQMQEMQKTLSDARAKSADAESNLNQISAALQGRSKEPLETLPVMLRNPLFMSAKAQEAEAEKRMNEASKRYGAEHPRFVAADTELKSAREALRRQIVSTTQTITREYEIAKANEQAADRALNSSRQEMQNLNRKEFQLASLEREVATNRQLYEMFVQRFKETNISGDMQSAVARVIDPALVPGGPYGPDKNRIISMAVMIALLVGCSLALLIERLDNTIKSSQDVETKLGVPLLGIVPVTKVKSGHQLERVFLEDPQSSFSEAIRTIRSGVMLSAVDSPKKVIVITSSVPSEGKTTVAINMAIALSQVKRTLLIDADMRRPRVGKVLAGKDASPLVGLAQLVAQEVTLDKCIFPVVDTNLHVLPAGRVPPNPLELLTTHRFTEVMTELGKLFDVIVIDSPPLQLVSDALVLSNVCTEMIFVAKADDTPYPLIRVGVKRLRRVNAPLVGIVLNQFDVERADKYYGEYSGRRYYGKYGKKYAYGYGPQEEKSAKA